MYSRYRYDDDATPAGSLRPRAPQPSAGLQSGWLDHGRVQLIARATLDTDSGKD